MRGMGRVAAGSAAGAALAGAVAPFLRRFFDAPDGGVGVLTVHGYPKGWDYAVLGLLVVCAAAGGALAARRVADPEPRPARRRPVAVWIGAGVVFLAMLVIHDHPFALMDNFHEGEHLTPAFLFRAGERPFRDVFLLHGLGVDGGLDALVMGDPPSPLRTRRLQTVLDAATLALLVPIAAELTATGAGLAAAVVLSLCGAGALWVPVFPYFRLAPVLLAALGLLRYARTGRTGALALAFGSATLGILWSLDTGTYALAGVAASFVLLRWGGLEAVPLPWGRVAALAAGAVLAPFALLLAVGADIGRFLTDSFVIIPPAIDAVWSLPAPAPLTAAGLRYYAPPVFYAMLLAFAWAAVRKADRRACARILVVALLSLVLFRTAAGRVSWSHTRFAVPMLGIAAVAFVLEPMVLRRRRLAAFALAVPLVFYFELRENVSAGWKLAAAWPARQAPSGLVPYPVEPGRGILTVEQNAIEIGTLAGYVESLGPGTILDFTNERALYYLLGRKPPTRCFDVPMLSAPSLRSEAMAELAAEPPVCVILGGDPAIATFDGVPNAQRVPELAAWIDANYPTRTEIGRFVVATR